MASTTTRPTSRKGFALRKLVWVGPLTIIVAVLVNLVIRTIAVVFLLLALVAFILVGRFARRPVGFYRILTLVALFVSFLNPIMALAGLYPAPGMNLHIFWTMIVMHTVTAIITVGLLTTLAVAKRFSEPPTATGNG